MVVVEIDLFRKFVKLKGDLHYFAWTLTNFHEFDI